MAAFGLRFLAIWGSPVLSDKYEGWKGDTEREVDWQSGCCVMLRGDLLKKLGGFDERFFYQFEEVDLCQRVWEAGFRIRFTPEVTITHLGGQSVGRFPVRFAIEVCRNGYRYFYKHYRSTRSSAVPPDDAGEVAHPAGWIRVRESGAAERGVSKGRLEMYRATIRWNQMLDPVEFVEHGTEQPVEQVTVPNYLMIFRSPLASFDF